MAFSSLEFIFRFFPAFLALYYLVVEKHRNKVLLIGSLCFYALGDIRYLPLIIISIFVNYLAVRQMIRHPNQEKVWLFVSLVYNIGTLFFFKYSNFLIENMNTILRISHYEKDLPLLNLGLPLGISFYTFQIISCVVDVYRKEIKEELTFFRFATYVTMFPKMLSGPITSYGEISDELSTRKYNIFKIEMGLRLFILGLGMKVLVADRIGMLWNDIQTIGFQSISTPPCMAGFHGIQYTDLSGFSRVFPYGHWNRKNAWISSSKQF